MVRTCKVTVLALMCSFISWFVTTVAFLLIFACSLYYAYATGYAA
jgi:hypothetical protein